MKTIFSFSAIALIIGLAVVGCSKSGDTVDASPIEKSFASAETTLKSAADKAVTAIKSADYSAATAELQKLAADVKLTPEQKQAVTDVINQIGKKLADAGARAADGANKVLNDASKALGK